MQTILIAIVAFLLVGGLSSAQEKLKADPAKVDAAIKAAFPSASADWQPRLSQDDTMKQCSQHANLPPKEVGEAIQKRERATIEYPADGKLLGDWKSGERIAQSGYGMRFTDYPARQPNGGNCYACHQLTKAELSYGTIGPPLLGHGKNRNFSEADTRLVYEKIYNAQASYPCSNMPRFGSNKVLTIEQIKDLVALVMSPESPVNR
jgi:sulfur-oxidizing protein SoxX